MSQALGEGGANGYRVRRIVLLTLGWEDLPKSVSVEGASGQEWLREPVPGVLLECDGGWLLLDTGFNRTPRCGVGFTATRRSSRSCPGPANRWKKPSPGQAWTWPPSRPWPSVTCTMTMRAG